MKLCGSLRWLSSLLLVLGASVAAADAKSDRVTTLIDALGLATQAGPNDDWRAQNEAQAAVARRIREVSAANPGSAELTEIDAKGRTPLVRAALWGYADVVDALLTDPGVNEAIDKRDAERLSPWIAAQLGRPMTLASCHPQILVREAVALWRPNLRRVGYFQQGSLIAFDRIRLALAAARATPDPDGAKRYWLSQCPGHDPALEPEIAASKNLLATLLTDTDKRLQAFGSDLNTKLARAPNALPPQPVIQKNHLFVQDPLALPRAHRAVCSAMSKPDIMNIDLPNGAEIKLKMTVEVQDGVPAAAAVEVLNSGGTISADSRLYVRASVFNALGGYRCAGDTTFDQEFLFTVSR